MHANIENIVIESFQSPFEEIKSAASYALGNIAVGNLSKYLPFILDQIDHQQKKQYLLLHSLKEVCYWTEKFCNQNIVFSCIFCHLFDYLIFISFSQLIGYCKTIC